MSPSWIGSADYGGDNEFVVKLVSLDLLSTIGVFRTRI